MREIVTKTAAYRTFRNDCTRGKAAHCYLLVGRDEMLLTAFCEVCTYTVLGGSGFNDLLWRKVHDRTHADVLYFPRDKKTVVKEEYEELLDEVGYAPIDGDRRVFVISDADKINVRVQNGLLKLLEEPPEGYVFLLKASTTAPVLQTVISRARVLELEPLTPSAMVAALRSIDVGAKATEEDVRWAVEHAGGNVTTAARLLSKPVYRGMSEAVWAFFTTCASSRDLLKWYDRWAAYEQNLDELLVFAAEAVRDVTAYLTAGERAVIARERMQSIRQVAQAYTVKALVAVADRIRVALRKLEGYGNRKAVIDTLLLGICEDKAKYAAPRT